MFNKMLNISDKLVPEEHEMSACVILSLEEDNIGFIDKTGHFECLSQSLWILNLNMNEGIQCHVHCRRCSFYQV